MSDNRYRFSGKEDQVTGDLDLVDFGARMLKPAIGRWMTIDPYAEAYYSQSPYRYTLGNPISYVDPDGKDTYYYNTVTGETTWIDDMGDDEYQYIQFITPDEDGAMLDAGFGYVRGSEVYVGNTSNGLAIANINLWEDMPDNLGGYQGYQYDMNDLYMRYYIRNSGSRVLKQALDNFENMGIAEPLTGSNYWNTYGHTLGSFKLMDIYLNTALAFTPSGISGQNAGKRTFSLKRGSATLKSPVISGGKPNLAEFNQFRSQNSGKFGGHQGRGTNTKVAWEAYLKAYGYR